VDRRTLVKFEAARGLKVTKVGVLGGADAGSGDDGERIG
jgi:hypothetical protein